MTRRGGARDELFDLASDRADVLDVARDLRLFRSGRTWRGECPINGCSAGKKADGAFWVDPRSQRFGCFSCDEKGDAIALEHALRSTGVETIRHAAARLARVDLEQWDAERKDAFVPVAGLGRTSGPSAGERRAREAEREALRAVEAARDADREAWILELAQATWRGARPARGTPVEAYLRARGVVGRPLDLALEQVRFHPEAHHSREAGRDLRLPGMIGLIVAPLGLEAVPTGGIHVTYLAEGGDLVWRRAEVRRSKTVWGPPQLSPAAVRPGDDRPDRWGGVWLTPPTGPGPLMVGEGIESTLSAAVLAGEPARAVAALSLNALQGGWREDRFGRVDCDQPRADPDAPAFTWPEPEAAPWGEVRLCLDRDMKPIKRLARRAGGGTWKRPLGPEDRMRICAALATEHWGRTLGATHRVRIWAPAPGRDFNDELRARTAAGSSGMEMLA